MLSRDEILDLLSALDAELAKADVTGELCLYGGAVMCLVFQARPATKDVDAVFEPADVIRAASASIANDRKLPADWLNDAVKGFLVEHSRESYLQLDHLRVLVPEPEYLLAMKALAARFDSRDKDDVIFLVRKLELATPEEVFAILESYYPIDQLKPATRFFVEELFQEQEA